MMMMVVMVMMMIVPLKGFPCLVEHAEQKAQDTAGAYNQAPSACPAGKGSLKEELGWAGKLGRELEFALACREQLGQTGWARMCQRKVDLAASDEQGRPWLGWEAELRLDREGTGNSGTGKGRLWPCIDWSGLAKKP
jgi:hypothetical protein